MRTRIKELYLKKDELKEVEIKGWVRNNRLQKEFGFLMVNDGSSFFTLQVVYDTTLSNFLEVGKFRSGSSVSVTGEVVLTPNSKQPFELHAKTVELLGDSPEDYPIQPKRHSREFLRANAHLRSRTNLFNATFRVRSLAAQAIHNFFQDRGFIYLHAPLITANDTEGAGEQFLVTTLDMNNLPKTEEGNIDYSKDFFGKQSSLTVSGQLEAEAFALSFGDVYTFGPTFRAENSNTQRHASEFWMIEPEMAFADLAEDMDVMESMVKYIIDYVLEHAPLEMDFFNHFVQKGILDKLKAVSKASFARVSHKEAIDILLNSGEKFETLPAYGEDLATEHEKYLTEKHFNGPVFITNWPKEIKAFYMRLNDDNKTVAAVDLLVPGSGELCGGSQREERMDVLLKRMAEFGIKEEDMSWYLDLRKYGGCVHSGFGMGFERMVMYLTGVENIRDVLPFARTPKNCEF